MLIDSGRFFDGDLAVWHQAESMDALHARMPGFHRRVKRSLRELVSFLHADSTGYLGVSWGKDSVVTAHLMTRCPVQVPVVWIKIWPLYNPDCELVRDAFLCSHDIDYHEIEVEWRPDQVRAWRDHATSGNTLSLGYSPAESAAAAGFKQAAHLYGDRHISGVRSEESGVRSIRMKRWGLSTGRTCAPIGHWSSQDVFSYLESNGLPVHPAYAMTRGGIFERERLRVDALGGGKGSDRPRWEGLYYGDRVRLIQDTALSI